MTSNDGAAREFQFTSRPVTEGHPDKIAEFSWERTDRAGALRIAGGLLPAETGARSV